jgi:hypothetical protein
MSQYNNVTISCTQYDTTILMTVTRAAAQQYNSTSCYIVMLSEWLQYVIICNKIVIMLSLLRSIVYNVISVSSIALPVTNVTLPGPLYRD